MYIYLLAVRINFDIFEHGCFSSFAEDQHTQDCQKLPWTNIWRMLYQEMASKRWSSSMQRWHKNLTAMKKGDIFLVVTSWAEYIFIMVDFQRNKKCYIYTVYMYMNWPTCLVFAGVCGQLTYSVHLWSSGRVSKFIVHLDEAIRFFAFYM